MSSITTPEESKVFYETQDKLYRLRVSWPGDLEALKTVMTDAYDFNSKFTEQQKYDVLEMTRFFFFYKLRIGEAKEVVNSFTLSIRLKNRMRENNQGIFKVPGHDKL